MSPDLGKFGPVFIERRNQYIWLTIYSDLITNLFLLFLSLYALSYFGPDAIPEGTRFRLDPSIDVMFGAPNASSTWVCVVSPTCRFSCTLPWVRSLFLLVRCGGVGPGVFQAAETGFPFGRT